MAEENISQEFRLKNIDETIILLHLRNKLMSQKHSKVFGFLNHIE